MAPTIALVGPLSGRKTLRNTPPSTTSRSTTDQEERPRLLGRTDVQIVTQTVAEVAGTVPKLRGRGLLSVVDSMEVTTVGERTTAGMITVVVIGRVTSILGNQSEYMTEALGGGILLLACRIDL